VLALSATYVWLIGALHGLADPRGVGARSAGERQYRRAPRDRSYPQSHHLLRNRLYARIAVYSERLLRWFSTPVDYSVDALKPLLNSYIYDRQAVDKCPLFARPDADMLALPPWTAVGRSIRGTITPGQRRESLGRGR